MILKFIIDIKQKMIDYSIKDNLGLIANMDETPVWFEMFRNETIERIWAKEVKNKTFGCDKTRISLILSILDNGKKLKPLIVFKGKTGNRFENKLQNNILVKNKEILVKCQDNAWVNNEIFYFWLNNVGFLIVTRININVCWCWIELNLITVMVWSFDFGKLNFEKSARS